MKKLLGIVVLGLLWSNISYAFSPEQLVDQYLSNRKLDLIEGIWELKNFNGDTQVVAFYRTGNFYSVYVLTDKRHSSTKLTKGSDTYYYGTIKEGDNMTLIANISINVDEYTGTQTRSDSQGESTLKLNRIWPSNISFHNANISSHNAKIEKLKKQELKKVIKNMEDNSGTSVTKLNELYFNDFLDSPPPLFKELKKYKKYFRTFENFELKDDCKLSIDTKQWTNCWGGVGFQDNRRYIGEWKNGRISGKGIYVMSIDKRDYKKVLEIIKNGDIYLSAYDIKSPVLSAILENKLIECVDTEKSSMYHCLNEFIVEIYVGYWKDNKRNGRGVRMHFGGTTYFGEYKDNKKHGPGTFISFDHGKYVGQWKFDLKHGQGTQTYAGHKYVGEWEFGLQHGQGTYTWASGTKYVGKFRFGKKHDLAKITLPDGEEKIVLYNNDRQIYSLSSKNKKTKKNQISESSSTVCKRVLQQLKVKRNRHGINTGEYNRLNVLVKKVFDLYIETKHINDVSIANNCNQLLKVSN